MKPVRKQIFGFDPFEDFDPDWAEPDLQGWGHEHGIFSACIKKLKPKLIVEVGTWKGASAIRMGQICRELGHDAEIVCVDTWLGDASVYIHTGTESQKMRFDSMRFANGYPMLYYTFLRNVVDAGLQDVITPFAQTSENAAKVLRHYRLKADLVYVDAVPEKEPVFRDLMFYWPLLRKRGHLIGNNFKNDKVRADVEKFAARMEVTPEDLGGKYRFVKG